MSSAQLAVTPALPAPRRALAAPRSRFDALQALARNQPWEIGDRELLLVVLLPHLDEAARDQAWAVIAYAERSRSAMASGEWPPSMATDRRPRENADEHYDRALALAEHAFAAVCRQALDADEWAATWSTP